MQEELVAIVRDYVCKTEDVVSLLLQGLSLKTKEDLLSFRSRMPQGVFYLNQMKHTFTFHGIGCRFESEYLPSVPVSERIEKPLNIDMEMSGIDSWKVYQFIENYYPSLKGELSAKIIKEEFERWVNEKIMYKKHDLYYFH